jgi:ABC-type spermidine/putrescine transport system permease subunit II
VKGATPGQVAAAALIAAFLAVFLVLPVGTVMYVAFTEKGTGAFTLVNFADFFRTELFVRSLWNSTYVSAMSVVWASALALPLAIVTTRFEFRGAALVQTLGFRRSAGRPSWARSRCSCSSAATAASTCCSTSGSASRSPSWRG